MLTVLRSARVCDLAPAQVWAQLLDDGIYLCSIWTMYRLSLSPGRTGNGAAARPSSAPEARAERPSTERGVVWDVTKLQVPDHSVYYELFMIIDISPITSSGGWWSTGRDR